jgi:starch phosphorylase
MFIADYDIALAGYLVQGVDVWINTPRLPWEACGTSGMKVLVNGGINLSERDGWWAEAYRPEVGWAIGDGQVHDADPAFDVREAEQLLTTLEKEVIPAFYDRDRRGIPRAWVERMRTSMAELTPRFSTNRMLREYIERLYLPALQNYQERVAGKGEMAALINQWSEVIRSGWGQLRFGKLELDNQPGYYTFRVPVYLGNLTPEAISVQLYADPANDGKPEIIQMVKEEKLAGAINGYSYSALIPAQRPAFHYTPRIIPSFKGAAIPLEANQILWYDANTGNAQG